MTRYRCRLCNRQIGWWRSLLAGICGDCSYRTAHGGSPLRWQDSPTRERDDRMGREL